MEPVCRQAGENDADLHMMYFGRHADPDSYQNRGGVLLEQV